MAVAVVVVGLVEVVVAAVVVAVGSDYQSWPCHYRTHAYLNQIDCKIEEKLKQNFLKHFEGFYLLYSGGREAMPMPPQPVMPVIPIMSILLPCLIQEAEVP